DCVRMHLTEHTLKYLPNEPVGPSGAPDKPGWMAGYLTDLDNFGSDQHVAAGTGGLDILSRKPNGHLVQYIAEQVQSPDGTFVGTGAQDQTDVLAQQWVRMAVKGTGGR